MACGNNCGDCGCKDRINQLIDCIVSSGCPEDIEGRYEEEGIDTVGVCISGGWCNCVNKDVLSKEDILESDSRTALKITKS